MWCVVLYFALHWLQCTLCHMALPAAWCNGLYLGSGLWVAAHQAPITANLSCGCLMRAGFCVMVCNWVPQVTLCFFVCAVNTPPDQPDITV
jgi:hypothetical protein